MSMQPSQSSVTTNGTYSLSSAPSTDNYSTPGIPSASGATFGVDLGEQLQRDGSEVPRVIDKCTQAIEAYGEDQSGCCGNER